ncbi:MAG: hypothetical protein BWY82_00364 [Verrucomicrobia bacterium ADurb.Bin474]|nr:MAG: hypothetical protein BWY82_00364 [Verrucomicrobia bacterium ADurb.Bin474]
MKTGSGILRSEHTHKKLILYGSPCSRDLFLKFVAGSFGPDPYEAAAACKVISPDICIFLPGVVGKRLKLSALVAADRGCHPQVEEKFAHLDRAGRPVEQDGLVPDHVGFVFLSVFQREAALENESLAGVVFIDDCPVALLDQTEVVIQAGDSAGCFLAGEPKGWPGGAPVEDKVVQSAFFGLKEPDFTDGTTELGEVDFDHPVVQGCDRLSGFFDCLSVRGFRRVDGLEESRIISGLDRNLRVQCGKRIGVQWIRWLACERFFRLGNDLLGGLLLIHVEQQEGCCNHQESYEGVLFVHRIRSVHKRSNYAAPTGGRSGLWVWSGASAHDCPADSDGHDWGCWMPVQAF